MLKGNECNGGGGVNLFEWFKLGFKCIYKSLLVRFINNLLI